MATEKTREPRHFELIAETLLVCPIGGTLA